MHSKSNNCLSQASLSVFLLYAATTICAQEVDRPALDTPAAISAPQAAMEAQSAADAAAMAADAAAGPPMGTRLELQLSDEATGRPVEGAGTHLSDRAGLGRTNKMGGDVWYMDDAYARGEIVIRCPATRALTGRRIKKIPFSMDGKATVVKASILLEDCMEPPEVSVPGIYSGYYQDGFENSQFIPCKGLPKDANFYGNGSDAAWVELDSAAYKQLLKRAPNESNAMEQGLYVVWQGVLKGPGSYGHMGMSSYHFKAMKVLDVSTSQPENCPMPWDH